MATTTLEFLLQRSNGAVLVPLKRTADLLGIEPQTLRNRLCAGKFPLQPRRVESRVYFDVRDIAGLIDRVTDNSSQRPTPRGPSRLAERQEAAARGITVAELRKQKNREASNG